MVWCKNRMQMRKSKLERTNQRRQAQRETGQQGNKTKHKGCCQKALTSLPRLQQRGPWTATCRPTALGERTFLSVCTYSATGVTRAAFTFRFNLTRTRSGVRNDDSFNTLWSQILPTGSFHLHNHIRLFIRRRVALVGEYRRLDWHTASMFGFTLQQLRIPSPFKTQYWQSA
jgi:hypothetical protein